MIKDGSIILHKVDGKQNQADVLTKHLGREALDSHLSKLGVVITAGRASSAPQALIIN